MATRRAIANGNWSSVNTWNGGAVPTNGDTVYANGFTVAIDQNISIGGANNSTVSAGSFVIGQYYEVTSVGSTAWTGIGATAPVVVGTVFLATGVGSGTGVAKARATICTAVNAGAGATTGGGSFTMSSSYALTVDIRAGTSTCLTTSGTASFTLDSLYIAGGSTSSAGAITNTGTGTITFTNSNLYSGTTTSCSAIYSNNGTLVITGGTINGGSYNACVNYSSSLTNSTVTNSVINGGQFGSGIQNNSTGTITINNCIINPSYSSNGNTQGCIVNRSTGTVVLVNCVANGTPSSTDDPTIRNTSAGTLTLSGCTLTGARCLFNDSTGTITATNCTFTASTVGNCVLGGNVAANVTMSGSFYDSSNGYPAIYVVKWKLGTTPTQSQWRAALNGTSTYVSFYTADNNLTQASPSDVRNGTVYASGSLTGTCFVPSASSVSYGASVDNTTGNAVLSLNDLLNFNVNNVNSNSIWSRLKNCSTVASVGGQLAALQ